MFYLTATFFFDSRGRVVAVRARVSCDDNDVRLVKNKQHAGGCGWHDEKNRLNIFYVKQILHNG